jgi:hypothetical protein
MRHRFPARQTHIPISLDVYDQLQSASCNTGYEKEDWEIASEAIDEWVRRHDPNSLPVSAHAGYQWKRLFLPDGTVLRTVFGGKNYHCMVEGDRIVYDKRTVSPSGFANAVGGIRRNAWKSTWILFPDSKDWKLADSLRTWAQPRPRRKPVDVPTVAADSIALPPAAIEPVSVPRPVRRGRLTLAAFKARHTRPTAQDEAPQTGDEGLEQSHPGSARAPSHAGFTCPRERRTNGEDRIGPLLRQQLLPLLYRMYAIDRQGLEMRAGHHRIGSS